MVPRILFFENTNSTLERTVVNTLLCTESLIMTQKLLSHNALEILAMFWISISRILRFC